MSQKKTKKNSWFEISNKVDGQPRSIKIHDEIGGWGVWAQDFVSELEAIDDDEIELDLFTPGGSIYHGFQIIKAIQNHPAQFTAKVDSFIGSMGTVIACACDNVKASKLASYWIHRAQGVAMGDADDIQKYGEDLAKLETQLLQIYLDKTGASEDQIREWMAEDRAWTSEEAQERGFVDEIYDATAANDLSAALLTAVMAISKQSLDKTPPQPSGNKPNLKPQSKMDEKEIQAIQAENDRLKAEAKAATDQLAAAKDEHTAAVEAARKETAERITEINALGDKFGFKEEAEAFAKEGKSVSDFRAHILNKSPEEWKNSLNIKNPTDGGNSQEGEKDQGKDIVNKIKARRKS